MRSRTKQLALALEATALAKRDVPDYTNIDHTRMIAKLTRLPTLSEVPYR